MFKALNNEDIIVGTFPIIEPAGSDSGGVLVVGTDYYTGSGDLDGPSTGSQRVYRQFANIIQGDSTSNLPIGDEFRYFSLKRNSFKEAINPRTFTIDGVGINTGSLTYKEGGRQYESTDTNYYLYPDIGVILANNNVAFTDELKGCSEETATFTNVFVRIDPSEFNYSTNPSFSDIDGNLRFSSFTDNPRTYITTIGFYNDNGDCLAVAKVDRPRENSFEKALSFRVEFKF